MTKNEIIDLIEDKITDIQIENNKPRCTEEYYIKNDAKIEVLEEIVSLIDDATPISLVRKVVFFKLKEDCKYYAEDGTEITSDMLMKYPHHITNDNCYLILN